MKIAKARLIDFKLVFYNEADELSDEYGIAILNFRAETDEKLTYKLQRKGHELKRLLQEITKTGGSHTIPEMLRLCRKAPVLLVVETCGPIIEVAGVLPRQAGRSTHPPLNSPRCPSYSSGGRGRNK